MAKSKKSKPAAARRTRAYPVYVFSKPFFAPPNAPGTYVQNGENAPSLTKGTDFGTVNDGAGSRTDFNLNNQGDAIVTLTGTPKVQIVADGPGFWAGIEESEVEVKPHTGKHFVVRFERKRPGEVRATVKVPYRVTGATAYTFTIRGHGVFGHAEVYGNGFAIADGEVNPNLHKNTDIGTVPLNGSRTVEFEVRNTGEGPLRAKGVEVKGAHAREFSYESHPGEYIKPGGTWHFGIKFRPKAVGVRTAVVNLTTTDPDNTMFVFAIQGTGEPRTRQVPPARSGRVRRPPAPA